jgi:hypothetical protein
MSNYPANFIMLKRGFGVSDPAHKVRKYAVGATFMDEAGNVFEYVPGTASATPGNNDVPLKGVVIMPAAGAVALTTTNAGTYAGCRVGVAQVAVTGIASTVQYFWVQTKTGAGKQAGVWAAADTEHNDNLYTTATPGLVHDDVDTATNILIKNMMFETVSVASVSAVNTSAQFYYPYIPTA